MARNNLVKASDLQTIDQHKYDKKYHRMQMHESNLAKREVVELRHETV
jgi:hypothetical protein